MARNAFRDGCARCYGGHPPEIRKSDDAIAKGREAAFHEEFEWFARELRTAGATVETSGPWPPYSFTDIELGVVAGG